MKRTKVVGKREMISKGLQKYYIEQQAEQEREAELARWEPYQGTSIRLVAVCRRAV